MSAIVSRRTSALLRFHAPLVVNAAALAVRLYAASVWARFAAEKIRSGWLQSDQLAGILDLVAKGHLPTRLPGYDALLRTALDLGLTAAGSRLLPVIEMAIAVGLLAGTRVRLVALLAMFVNLNLLLSGIGAVALDGRLLILELALVGAGARAAHPSWRDAVAFARRVANGEGLHPTCPA